MMIMIMTVHRDKFPYNKTNVDALISQIYFGMKLYMFRTVSLSIIRSCSLYTQQCYVIQTAFEQDQDGTELAGYI
jgi:hypothetical protein